MLGCGTKLSHRTEDRELLLWYHNLCPNSTFIAAENGWGLFVLDSVGITVVRVELAVSEVAALSKLVQHAFFGAAAIGANGAAA
jgi:hypothetical protein